MIKYEMIDILVFHGQWRVFEHRCKIWVLVQGKFEWHNIDS